MWYISLFSPILILLLVSRSFPKHSASCLKGKDGHSMCKIPITQTAISSATTDLPKAVNWDKWSKTISDWQWDWVTSANWILAPKDSKKKLLFPKKQPAPCRSTNGGLQATSIIATGIDCPLTGLWIHSSSGLGLGCIMVQANCIFICPGVLYESDIKTQAGSEMQ